LKTSDDRGTTIHRSLHGITVMATTQVPGYNPANQDILAPGNWAEAKDGSLVYVKSIVEGVVVYDLFDTSVNPILQYMDRMPEGQFKTEFSYKSSKDIAWIWHDKTPFDWNRVISSGERQAYNTTHQLITDAVAVALKRELSPKPVDPNDYTHLVEREAKSVATSIMDKISNALGKLTR
jgi:hypothetical protein